MIRSVVIHVANEQPLLADLFDLPTSADAGLVCTNLRAMDGKRPVFIDHSESTFFFPYLVIRFLEIPPGAIERHVAEGGRAGQVPSARTVAPVSGDAGPGSNLPVPVEDAPAEDAAADMGEEIDEDFLRRIREV